MRDKFIEVNLVLFGSFDKIPSSNIDVLFLKNEDIEKENQNPFHCRIGFTEEQAAINKISTCI